MQDKHTYKMPLAHIPISREVQGALSYMQCRSSACLQVLDVYTSRLCSRCLQVVTSVTPQVTV
jgi:hypothetical protein